MPKKTCPECKATHGPRKKLCDCGYAFTLKNHPLVPEPGGWVLDKTKGMAAIPEPEPLPKGLLTHEQIGHTVAYEGLGFCIYHYISPEKIKDRKLRSLWVKARAAMQRVLEELY